MSSGPNPRILVDNALTLLSKGLREVVDRVLTQAYGTSDWHEAWAEEETKRRGHPFNCAKDDVQIHLIALTSKKHLFRGQLNDTQFAYASELRDLRNRWAHLGPISADDALRALDTTERLCRGVGAVAAADEARSLRLAAAETADRSVFSAALKASGSDTGPRAEYAPPNPARPAREEPQDVPVTRAEAPPESAGPPIAPRTEPTDPHSDDPLSPHLPVPSFQFSLTVGYELEEVDRFVELLHAARCGRRELIRLRDRTQRVNFGRVRGAGYLLQDVDHYLGEVLSVIDARLLAQVPDSST